MGVPGDSRSDPMKLFSIFIIIAESSFHPWPMPAASLTLVTHK
ncbi:hypothetical protein M7I_2415 [Glarea lozoyensis 74030]|uniref:Uncharacterized protein n=1 Tax=Glarea lozoyensis (strain ATCC 74030 / MF5533) TaxID=1104152 RepID=H0EIQ2_GLAL7|nr:hypothetical protein M7I_2415 [Glarea lozoyensis 74030]